MPKFVVIDELSLTFTVAADLPDADAEIVRRMLARADFLARLRRAVRGVIRAAPELVAVRLTVAR